MKIKLRGVLVNPSVSSPLSFIEVVHSGNLVTVTCSAYEG